MKLFVVIGLGQFGWHTAIELFSGGAEVIAIDADPSRIEKIKDNVGQAICADGTDKDALLAIGAAKADTAIVAFGEDQLETSIICCSTLADLGVARIIVRASSEVHGNILLRVGASKIIYPEQQMGEEIARSLIAPGVLEQVTLSTGQIVANIRPREQFIGKTLGDCQFPERFRILVIGIQHPKRSIDDRGEVHEEFELVSIPDNEVLIGEEDILIIVGNQSQIDQVSRQQ